MKINRKYYSNESVYRNWGSLASLQKAKSTVGRVLFLVILQTNWLQFTKKNTQMFLTICNETNTSS